MRAIVAIFLAALAGVPSARAECPDWLMADMVARSVPSYEIGRMCGPPATRSVAPAPPSRSLGPVPAPTVGVARAPVPPPQRFSDRCVIPAGQSCTTASPRIAGSPCWCELPGAPYADGTIE